MVTLIEIAGYALVDAVNPCALAVMIIVLMNLLIEDKTKKAKVLYGGFAFTLAVFLLYFLYGILLAFIFKPATGGVFASYVFKGFGIFSVILGILNLKDFFVYRPGGIATEMPISFRPKMRLWINKIRTIKGAFIIGLLVTLFLLPCTIGPYVIASARLSVLSSSTIIFWLVIYNIIFITPMLGVTLAIFLGVTTLESVGGWREKNIRYLHLVEGLILVILGILMITGILQ
jgi:cytochrome c biogenesis protein CcdA